MKRTALISFALLFIGMVAVRAQDAPSPIKTKPVIVTEKFIFPVELTTVKLESVVQPIEFQSAELQVIPLEPVKLIPIGDRIIFETPELKPVQLIKEK